MTLSPDAPGLTTETREDAFRRLTFLAEASALLAASLDPESVLRRIADLLVPAWADWCLIDVGDDGGMKRVAVAHADPARGELARTIATKPPNPREHPALQAVRAREGQFYTLVTEELMKRWALDEEHLAAMHEVQPHSLITVPLVVRSRTIGAITLITAESLRTYSSDDLAFAEEIARRAALAVDNARLFAEVQEAEQRYRALVQNLEAIVWEADAQPFRLRFISGRVQDILGYPVEAWLADPDLPSRVTHPNDADAVRAVFRAAIRQGRKGELEYRAQHADGRWVWLRLAIDVECDASGTPRVVRGLVSDVTARKTEELYERAQAAADHVLAAAETTADVPADLMRAICETLGWHFGAVWQVDEQTDVLRCLDRWTPDPEGLSEFAEVSGTLRFPPGTGLPGRVWRSREPTWIADVSNDPNFSRSAVALKTGLRTGMGFPIISGGRVIGVMEFYVRESRPPDENLLALMATIGTQIGQFFERKRFEEALRASEARTRAVVESALDAVIAIDHEGRILEFNSAAEQMFGYRREDAIGAEMAELIVPPSMREAHRRGLQRFLATGEARIMGQRLELMAMRADRSQFPVEVTITRVETVGPPVFTGYVRDITERAAAERMRDAQHAVTRVLSQADSLESAAPRILEAICASQGWDLGIVWEVRRRPDALRAAGSWWSPDTDGAAFADVVRGTSISKGEGVAGRVWETGRPVWPTGGEEAQTDPLVSAAGSRAALAFPILAGEHVLGVLEFFGRDTLRPETELIGMLGSIGTQIAQFIIRRTAEEATRFQKAMLESQNEATIDGIIITSPRGEILSFNRRFVELFNIPERLANGDDMTAFGDHVLAQMTDQDAFLQRAIELYNSPDEHDRSEMALADGRIFDRYTAPLRSEDGRLFGRAWYYRDITANKRAEAALAANNQRFAFLAEASTVLGGSLDLDQTLQTLTQISVPYLADVCVVDLLEQDGTVRSVAMHAAERTKLELLERRLAERRHFDIDPDAARGVPKVLRSGVSDMATHIEHDWLEALAQDDQEYLERIRSFGFQSYMCVPLIARGQILGAITFLTADSGRRYAPPDLALAEDLARRAALAVDNARLFSEREHVARTLQDSLLPPTLPEIPGCEVGAAFHFAGRGSEVGGDFYDLFDTGDDEWALVIGDVCGKGAPAAALTALSRYTLRAAAIQARKPNRVLSMLNEAILRQSSERFCTVAYARLSGTAGEPRRLTVACGGHPQPFILRADGTVEAIGVPGSLLGVFADATLSDVSTTLERGDAVILYTDGVTEARNEDGELGEEGLREIVARCAGLDAAAIAASIGRSAIEMQNGQPKDDIAVVVVRVA